MLLEHRLAKNEAKKQWELWGQAADEPMSTAFAEVLHALWAIRRMAGEARKAHTTKRGRAGGGGAGDVGLETRSRVRNEAVHGECRLASAHCVFQDTSGASKN